MGLEILAGFRVTISRSHWINSREFPNLIWCVAVKDTGYHRKILGYAWINSWCLPSVILPVVKSPELTQCKFFFANPCADTDILRCICPGKKSSLGTQDFLSGGHPVQNMTQDFLQIFFEFFTVPLPHGARKNGYHGF